MHSSMMDTVYKVTCGALREYLIATKPIFSLASSVDTSYSVNIYCWVGPSTE